MFFLPNTMRAWETPGFEAALKEEIARLDPALLPLQQGLTQGSHAIGDNLSVMITGLAETPDRIRVRTGIQYHGIIAGCSCADDPSPVDRTNEYCELQFDIDKGTAAATVTLIEE